MRVLLTNITLASRTGTEIVTRDLALGLRRAGHEVSVYSPELGPIADELAAGGVRVASTLAGMDAPDVVHAHHAPQCMAAVLRFPRVPAVFVCHDAHAWHDEPPRFEQVRRYVAVDGACRERLLAAGVPTERIAVVPNAVDLDRFQPRGPLPPRPQRAALFSNSGVHVAAVRLACERAGVGLDLLGRASGAYCERPEDVLGQYDLVFAKARGALEAAAVGCAVVLCDAGGLGPLLSLARLDELRADNLGFRTLVDPLDPALVEQRIAAYDPLAAAHVSARVRATAGLDAAVAAYLRLYEEARRASGPSDLAGTVAIAAELAERHAVHVSAHERTWRDSVAVHGEWKRLVAEYERLEQEYRRVASAYARLEAEHARSTHELRVERAQLAELQAFAAEVQRSPLFALRRRVSRTRAGRAVATRAGALLRRLVS